MPPGFSPGLTAISTEPRRTDSPSGRQFELRHGSQRAVICEVGATLREYEVGGEPVIDGFGVDQICDGARGQVLMPWPNRVRDGAYEFASSRRQLALSEPRRRNAIHGLVRWATWLGSESGSNSVRMTHRLYPQPGYPFQLEINVTYSLGDQGLEVTTRVVNRGTSPCPFGAGFHPYLRLGPEPVDKLELTVAAATRLLTDQRAIPIGSEPVAGTQFDFRTGRRIGNRRLDTCLTDLDRDPSGRAWVRVASRLGSRRLWMDTGFRYLMLYTGDTLAPDRRRTALAVEPMSCAPNAFQTGAGLTVLAAGQRFTASWGISSD